MESIRKWFYKPKRDDPSLLAQFFYADEALNLVAAELDSFDGRKDPERCTALVNHLRQCQDKVLTICNRIMDDLIPTERANRDFRVKFPDDVMQENLAGQLWFGAECLAAGSSIMNREGESSAMRPLAKALTKALENVRNLLREQCLRGNTSNSSLKPNLASGMNEIFSERLQEALKIFDRLFAEFELCYVSAMVPVKSTKEYELQQLVVVLFSETLQRALKMKLLTQEMVDDYDPALMFTIPRLAIVSGLLIFPDGPLCLDRTPADMSEMFRPFRTLLHKIRELLWTLNNKELFTLEKLLCSSEEPCDFRAAGHSVDIHDDAELVTTNSAPSYPTVPDLDDFVTRFYIDYPNCKQFVTDFYASTSSRNAEPEMEDSVNSGANVTSRASTVTEMCVDIPKAESKTEKKEKVCSDKSREIIPSWDSTEESEDETEWVGETSECETVITDAYNEAVPGFETEENGSSVESDSKTLVSLPDDFSSNKTSPVTSTILDCLIANQIGVRENMVFGEAINAEQNSASTSSSSSDSHFDFQGQETLVFESQNCTVNLRASTSDSEDPEPGSHVACSDTIEIPTPVASGFLLANQVGHESMLASIERISSPRMPDLSPGTGGSLPDGDTREALSVATATLSSLLLSSPNISPVGSSSRNTENDVEEDSSIQSPLDSGVGTVVSCSDAGSFSDRSPDTASAPGLITIDTKAIDVKVPQSDNTAENCYNSARSSQQRWQVETIPCSCTLSDKSAICGTLNKCVNDSVNGGGNSGSNSNLNETSQTNDTQKCCSAVIRTSNNNNICDNTSGSSGDKDIRSVSCQDCLLPIEVDNLDKEDLISSDHECFKVLSDKCEQNKNCTTDDVNKCDKVLHSEIVSRSCSDCNQSSSSLHNHSQQTSVLISRNVDENSYRVVDVDSTMMPNANMLQDNEMSGESTDSSNRIESCTRPGEPGSEVTSTEQLNGSHKDVVYSSDGSHEHKCVLPSIVVKMEEERDKGGGEEWFGIASGDGQCTLCSSNDADESQSHTPERQLNYARSWASLFKQQSESLRLKSETPDLGSERTATVTSHSEQNILENGMSIGSREPLSQTSSSGTVASSQSTTSDAVPHRGGSTLAVVPSRSGRSHDVALGSSYSSTSSSCQSSVTASSDSCSMSSETSSFNSECQDDEEIALAMQAAEIANRNEARAKFRSSEDLVHRLFVCIAGVADQLQTNFAGDLRHILKCVFLMSAANNSNVEEQDLEESLVTTISVEQEPPSPPSGDSDVSRPVENAEEALSTGWESPASPMEVESPPPWIPDDMAPRCMSCEAVFTVVRRRHHCRNCGKVFCARCSSNSVPLPRYGHVKPVRVCNRCFLYQVTPFTLEELATRS